MPSEVVDIYNDQKSKPSWYDYMSNSAEKEIQRHISKLVKADDDEIGKKYSSSHDDILKIASLVQNNQSKKYTTLNNLQNSKKIEYDGSKYVAPKQVNDLEYTGKNMVLVTPKNKFYLDDFDTVLAAKKGGFLNKMFIGLTEYFSDSKESSNTKIVQLKSQLNEAKIDNKILSENIINRENIEYEADEEDFLKLFDLYDNIINIVTSKQNTLVKTNVAFDV